MALSTRIPAPLKQDNDCIQQKVIIDIIRSPRDPKPVLTRVDPHIINIIDRTTTNRQDGKVCKYGKYNVNTGSVVNELQSRQDEGLGSGTVEDKMGEQGLDIEGIKPSFVEDNDTIISNMQRVSTSRTVQPNTSEQTGRFDKMKIPGAQGKSKSSAPKSIEQTTEQGNNIQRAKTMIETEVRHGHDLGLNQLRGEHALQHQTNSTNPCTPVPLASSISSSGSTSVGRQVRMSAPLKKHTIKRTPTLGCRGEARTPPRKQSATLSRSTNGNRSIANSDGNSTSSTPMTPRPNTVQSRTRPQSSTTQPVAFPKTPFTTYQRTFTPSKPRTISSSASPNRPYLPTTSLPNLAHLRLQTHLIHLSLLSSTAPRTLSSYIFSARTHLSATHLALQSIHAELLPLIRRSRQYRNLWSMDQWSGGNIVGLSRKVGNVIAVLEELVRLTEPGSARQDQVDSEFEGGKGREEGAYSTVLRRFVQWIDWVEDVWANRDSFQSSLSPVGNGKGMVDMGQGTTSEQAPPKPTEFCPSDQTRNHYGHHFLTPIDALGDSTTADIRALTHLLHGLSLRLDEVRQTPFPSTQNIEPPSSVRSPTETERKAAPTSTTKASMSDPERIISNTLALLQNMQEELQLIREVEFEVVVGERAWREEALRCLKTEVGMGFD